MSSLHLPHTSPSTPVTRPHVALCPQVLPFLYTHMVSLSCTIYLMGSAFLRGAAFTPEADLPGGLIIPLIYVVLTNLTIYGLLCVGDTVFDPFGDDYEDFAVLRFIEHTATASYEATLDFPSLPFPHLFCSHRPCSHQALYCEEFEPPEEFAAEWQSKQKCTAPDAASAPPRSPPRLSGGDAFEQKERQAAHMKAVRARRGSTMPAAASLLHAPSLSATACA